MTKIVYLEYKSDPITVTKEAFDRILSIIEENHACRVCDTVFTLDNPCVSLNTCLQCYLARHSGLTYIGLVSAGQYSNTYGYLSEQGMVYTSYAGNDKQAERSDYYTLRHWGFMVPGLHTYKGEEKKLDPYYWHIYGDVVHHEAVVAQWHSSYAGFEYVCILYKDGSLLELNKRSKETKGLFKRAIALAESYKDEHGSYNVNGYSIGQLNDWVVYMLIAELATQDYREKIRQERQQKVADLLQQWLSGDDTHRVLSEIVSLYEQLGETRNVQRFTMLLSLEQEGQATDQHPERVVS